ncbi:MAG: hypothetical protein AAF491_00165 [Verrucomicrobiota bacterium]
MKTQTPIQIRAGDLKPAVAGLGKLIPRSQNSLPVLHCVKVEMPKQGILRFTATDLNVTLTLDVTATWEKKVEPFLVPMHRLREITQQTRADDQLTISPVAKTPPIEEFPDTSGFRASPIELSDSAVAGLVHAFACSSRDESRHILRGAFLDTSGKGPKAHRIVGTDGRHLFSSNSLHLPGVKNPVILPDHKIWQWKPIAEARPWTLRIGTEKNDTTPFRIVAPGWSVHGTTIDGNYPNYRQVVPPGEQFKTRVALSEEALDAMVRLIPRLPGKKLANHPVGLHLEKGRLGLLARESNDESWILHPIDAVEGRGPDLCAFVNRDYLKKAAAFGLGEINLIDAMSPVQFCRGGDLMIVMPVRANDPERIERPKTDPAVKPSSGKRKKPASSKPRRSRPSRKKARPQRETDDPIGAVESRIAKANEALASAGQQLDSAKDSLRTARRRRSEDHEELRGFRSLFSSIRKIAGGSN